MIIGILAEQLATKFNLPFPKGLGQDALEFIWTEEWHFMAKFAA